MAPLVPGTAGVHLSPGSVLQPVDGTLIIHAVTGSSRVYSVVNVSWSDFGGGSGGGAAVAVAAAAADSAPGYGVAS